jgi:hypothetical protein
MVTANTCIVKVPELFNCDVLVSTGGTMKRSAGCQQFSANHGTFRAMKLQVVLAESLAIGSLANCRLADVINLYGCRRWPIRSSSGSAVTLFTQLPDSFLCDGLLIIDK